MSKPVRKYQDCAVCDIGHSAKIFMNKVWWTTSVVLDRRDTPEGLPRFETMNTIYTPDAHDGGDPLNRDYEVSKREKVNLSNPFVECRFVNDELVGADITPWDNY
jgi:hypothetical protein